MGAITIYCVLTCGAVGCIWILFHHCQFYWHFQRCLYDGCSSYAFYSEAVDVLMRLEYEVWLSGVEYVILALTTDVKRMLFVSHTPGATLADPTVSAGLLPLNIAKIFFFFLIFFRAKFHFWPAPLFSCRVRLELLHSTIKQTSSFHSLNWTRYGSFVLS